MVYLHRNNIHTIDMQTTHKTKISLPKSIMSNGIVIHILKFLPLRRDFWHRRTKVNPVNPLATCRSFWPLVCWILLFHPYNTDTSVYSFLGRQINRRTFFHFIIFFLNSLVLINNKQCYFLSHSLLKLQLPLSMTKSRFELIIINTFGGWWSQRHNLTIKVRKWYQCVSNLTGLYSCQLNRYRLKPNLEWKMAKRVPYVHKPLNKS